jgi:hypothetical protein
LITGTPYSFKYHLEWSLTGNVDNSLNLLNFEKKKKIKITLIFFLLSAQGHYIFIESSSPRRVNDTARIISLNINPVTITVISVKYDFTIFFFVNMEIH